MARGVDASQMLDDLWVCSLDVLAGELCHVLGEATIVVDRADNLQG